MARKRLFGMLLLVLGLTVPGRVAAQPQRVGLQAGHWRSSEFPEELKRLRGSTGAAAGGVREYQVNLDVAQRAAGYLRGAGIAVDVLPATVPINYRADAFVSIHADGSTSRSANGFKIATHWREWEAGLALVDALRTEYGAASGLRWDGGRISSNMRGYYAFSSGRYDHAIHSTTPAAILEMGYLTNPSERAMMTQQADRLARGVANGVLRFLGSEPAGGWPPAPPMPDYRAVTTGTANLRSGPGTEYPIVRVLGPSRTLLVAEVRGEWLKLLSYRSGRPDRWIHRDTVRLDRLSDDPPQDS